MASRLLDDTIVSVPSMNLPVLSQLNRDEAWAQKTTPAVMAGSESNTAPYPSGFGFPEQSDFFSQSVEQSTPPIPRRVSYISISYLD